MEIRKKLQNRARELQRRGLEKTLEARALRKHQDSSNKPAKGINVGIERKFKKRGH